MGEVIDMRLERQKRCAERGHDWQPDMTEDDRPVWVCPDCKMVILDTVSRT